MRLRPITFLVMICVLILTAAASAQAQLATTQSINADSQQTDKVLFGQAMWAMEKSQYAEARTLLAALIDRHPESDYVPVAKLSIGDSWYEQGSFENARLEYQDFVTFFPNRPEVAEAQRKLDAIRKR